MASISCLVPAISEVPVEQLPADFAVGFCTPFELPEFVRFVHANIDDFRRYNGEGEQLDEDVQPWTGELHADVRGLLPRVCRSGTTYAPATLRDLFLIVRSGRMPIGIAILRIKNQTIHVEDCVVEKYMRGRRIGECFVSHIVAEAYAAKLRNFTAVVSGDNPRALEFWKRCGLTVSTVVHLPSGQVGVHCMHRGL